MPHPCCMLTVPVCTAPGDMLKMHRVSKSNTEAPCHPVPVRRHPCTALMSSSQQSHMPCLSLCLPPSLPQAWLHIAPLLSDLYHPHSVKLLPRAHQTSLATRSSAVDTGFDKLSPLTCFLMPTLYTEKHGVPSPDPYRSDVSTVQKLLRQPYKMQLLNSEWNFPSIFGKRGGFACEHLGPRRREDFSCDRGAFHSPMAAQIQPGQAVAEHLPHSERQPSRPRACGRAKKKQQPRWEAKELVSSMVGARLPMHAVTPMRLSRRQSLELDQASQRFHPALHQTLLHAGGCHTRMLMPCPSQAAPRRP